MLARVGPGAFCAHPDDGRTEASPARTKMVDRQFGRNRMSHSPRERIMRSDAVPRPATQRGRTEFTLISEARLQRSARDRLVEGAQHLLVARVVVHALDVVEAASIGDSEQIAGRGGLLAAHVQQASGAAQRADSAAASVPRLIAALYPVLAVLDQRAADLQRLDGQVVGRNLERRVQGAGRLRLGRRPAPGARELADTLPEIRLRRYD